MKKIFEKSILVNSLLTIFTIYITLAVIPPILTIPSVEKRIFKQINKIDRNLSNPELIQARKAAANIAGKTFDERSVLQYYQDLENKDSKISLYITNSTRKDSQKIDPSIVKDVWGLSLGISNTKKLLIGNESGYFSYRKTDKFGFLNDNSIYSEKDKILIIGDSFGNSTAVNYEDSIDYHLKNNHIKAANLSVGDNALISYLAILREYGAYTKPKQVILLYYEENDIAGTNYELQIPEIAKYFYDSKYSQNLINRTDEIDASYKRILDIFKNRELQKKLEEIKASKENNPKGIRHSILKFFRLHYFKNLIKPLFNKKGLNSLSCNSPDFNQDMAKIDKIMKNIKFFTNEKLGVKLKVFYLPDYTSFYSPHCHKKYFIEILKNNNIEFFDFSEVILKENYKDFFPYGLPGHYNEYGYKKLSEFIIRNL